tara:strand:+ start:229 stop:786 length:558 start_codon:yes stop_codon:yes gene_type:complete
MRFLLFFSCLTVGFVSCNQSSEYTSEVKKINSLLEQVAEAKKEFDEIPHKEINSRLESIKSTIKFVEEASGGEIDKNNGLLLDSYRGVKSVVKRFGKRTSQMKVEFGRTKSQLENFKQALLESASHDKNNSQIDKAYVKLNMKKEEEAASTLISSVEELKARGIRFIKQNDEKSAALAPYLNSLK